MRFFAANMMNSYLMKDFRLVNFGALFIHGYRFLPYLKLKLRW